MFEGGSVFLLVLYTLEAFQVGNKLVVIRNEDDIKSGVRPDPPGM